MKYSDWLKYSSIFTYIKFFEADRPGFEKPTYQRIDIIRKSNREIFIY